ncbi:MAG: serine/threonine-protein kinase [Acidobacteriota bacterium]
MSVCVFTNCPAPDPGPQDRCLGCSSLLLGAQVRERYIIEEVRSRGKFNVSYLVHDLKAHNATRILKELQPVSEDDPDFYSTSRSMAERLFEREARVLLTLQHRGIPRLFATFEENNYWYLVQEYIPGQTLLEWLETRHTLVNEAEARAILQELAQILVYLHSRTPAVIHRDIKPQNLMRAEEDHRLLLIEFAAVSQAVVDRPQTGTVIGTAGYAPAEQLYGKAVPQSDLYAAGATMLRLITGLHPSKLYNPIERRFNWEQHARIGPSFAEVINGLLAYELTDRTSSAEELIAQLAVLRPLN